jgi:hypothetical protein
MIAIADLRYHAVAARHRPPQPALSPTEVVG